MAALRGTEFQEFTAGVPAFVSLTGTNLDRPIPTTDLQIGSRHWDVTGILGNVIDDGFGGKYLMVAATPDDWQFGATRGWHFLFAWVLGLSLPLYGLYVLWSGRLRRRLLPTRGELTVRSIAHELWLHLRLKRARGESARRNGRERYARPKIELQQSAKAGDITARDKLATAVAVVRARN